MMNYLGTEKTHVSVGPWGGPDGARWDDGIYNTAVRQVVICHGAAIDSIQIEYENICGSSVWSDKHGGPGCIKTSKIKLDVPKEYLISISGYYGSIEEYCGEVHVRSLTLESNKKKYGPFGIQHGIQFSCPLNYGKIVGFHGRSSWHLDSIGVHLKPIPHPNLSNANSIIPPPNFDTTYFREDGYTIQGFGKLGRKTNSEIIRSPIYGSANSYEAIFDYEIDKSRTVERRVINNLKDMSNTKRPEKTMALGLWAEVQEPNNVRRVINNVKDMSNTKRPEKAVALDPWAEVQEPNNVEIIRCPIYGSANSYGAIFDYETDKSSTVGRRVINNVKDMSNTKRPEKAVALGPWAEVQEHNNIGIIRPFIYGPATPYGVILDYEIDKIGTVGPAVNNNFKDIGNGPTSKNPMKASSYGPRVEVQEHKNVVSPARMVKEQITIKSETWGGIGGKPWDDGVFSGVKSVYLTKGEAIYCIQIEYDNNGQPVWSPRHGGGSERDSQTIKLDYPNEVLTGVSGSYESLNGDDTKCVIKSLTFYTNKGKHGPYGEQSGKLFSYNKSEGRIVGFHGRSGCYLNSVGVHIQKGPNI